MQTLPEQQQQTHIRNLCRTDLYFLLRYVLKRADMEHPWLFARCREVEEAPNGMLDLWSREHYKDLANDTPMLTYNRGWVTHGDLVAGDMVYAPDGNPVAVLAVSEQYTDSECYRVSFSCGAEIVAGAGHLWRVRRKTTKRIPGTDRRTVSWVCDVVKTIDLPNRADIGVMEGPLYGDETELPLAPYVLGAWLGDGSSVSPRITAGYDDADEMHSLLASNGVAVRRTKHANAISLTIGNGQHGKRGSSNVMNALRAIGVVGNKHIPATYLSASARQRMMLLRGLMDTDGHCNTRGTATFVNANERLANDVFELAAGLGLRPRFGKYVSSCGEYQGTAYQVRFQAHYDRNPFLMQRKARRAIKPSQHRLCRDVVSVARTDSVPTRCIQVDGGMYLAGRGLIPTHNSTVITFGKTIQDVLASHGENPLAEWGGREATIGIFSHTRPAAKGFLRQIKREFEANALLKELFPDVLWDNPQKESPKWSEDDGIVVKRKSNPKEATIEAWGLVDGQPIGMHYLILNYDDVVTAASVYTPEMIQKTTSALELSYNLGADGGFKRFIGTRYHFNDSYKTIIDRGTAKPRIYPATLNGEFDGEPVLWTREKLAEKRRDMGPYTAACQLMQNPKADETQGFKREWLKHYLDTAERGTTRYILVDAANGKRPSNDYTSMWVIGLGEDKNYYVLDLIRDRLNLTQRTSRLIDLHKKWKPIEVRYERYGMMADIDHLKAEQGRVNYRFDVVEVGGNIPKNDRIKRLIPIFEQGKFYFPLSMHKTDYQGMVRELIKDFIEEEYAAFPVGIHDDMLDALARIAEPDLPLSWPMEQPDGADLNPEWYPDI